jgi:hypothetical protein
MCATDTGCEDAPGNDVDGVFTVPTYSSMTFPPGTGIRVGATIS